jgi:hypothetical protein
MILALALTSRRGAIAAAASALAAIALAAAVLGRGCGVAPPGPDAAVKSLVQAARAGDREAVWVMLSPATDLRVVSRDGDRAVVELGGPTGRARIDVVRIDGRWKIDLPAYRQP